MHRFDEDRPWLAGGISLVWTIPIDNRARGCGWPTVGMRTIANNEVCLPGRARMVDQTIAWGQAMSARVEEAMLTVARHSFVPDVPVADTLAPGRRPT